MSDTIHEGAELVVGTFAGPGAPGDRGRRRWQFTIVDGGDVAVLDDDELAELVLAISVKLGRAPHDDELEPIAGRVGWKRDRQGREWYSAAWL